MTALVTVEEECFVLNDGSADRATIGVPDQRCARNLWASMIVEPIVGGEAAAPIKFKPCSVPIIGARLSHQVDLGAGRATLVCVSVRGGDAELFDCLRIQPENRTRSNVASVRIQLTDHQAIGA